MRLLEQFPHGIAKWDEFRAFHVTVGRYGIRSGNHFSAGPVILFDTGELIVTHPEPDPGERGLYGELNIELAKSDEFLKGTDRVDGQPLYAPNGEQLRQAWFVENVWLLIDHDSHRAVRLNGKGSDGRNEAMDDHRRAAPGIPRRFQQRARGYIGGPGQLPVGRGTIKIQPPAKESWTTVEQREHILALHTVCRAEAQMLDYEPIMKHGKPDGPVPFERLMAVKSWRDLNEIEQRRIYHYGESRPVLELDYLLTEPPR